MSKDQKLNLEDATLAAHERSGGPVRQAEDREGRSADERVDPVTEAEREHGSGKFGRLAGPRPPAPQERVETPVMGVVPPEPNTPDEAGEIDVTRGDPTRVREARRGSSADDEAAEEARRRARYEEGATEVSEM